MLCGQAVLLCLPCTQHTSTRTQPSSRHEEIDALKLSLLPQAIVRASSRHRIRERRNRNGAKMARAKRDRGARNRNGRHKRVSRINNMVSRTQQKQHAAASRRTCQHSCMIGAPTHARENAPNVCLCAVCVGRFFFFDFWRAVRQSTNREIPPRCYATLSGQVFRRSLRLGVTMQDRACAAMGNSSALWQSRFRRRSVGRTPKSLDRAGSHSPISTS